jgi:hypothetical protein
MNDPQKFRERLWRRPLSAVEADELRAWLAEHPETQADWDLEKNLTEAFGNLPDAPVSSNFTARVLQAVERESRAEVRSKRTNPFWKSWLPRVAFSALLLCGGFFTYHQHTTAKRLERAQNVAAISEVAPDPAVLKDFDAIRHLNRTSVAPDEELLALLQ